ncbi:MAG: hypothetical protein R3E12_17520 [Candidatus Eisenbacteria bacterium]
MSSGIRHRWYWLLLCTLVVLGLPSGCEKDDTTAPVRESDVKIGDVEIERTVLGPGDSTVVSVQVLKGDDTPLDGVEVSFSELPSQTQQSFSKAAVLTDAQGWANTVYRPVSGYQGTVTLKVSAGDDKYYATLEVSAVSETGVSIAFSTASGATSLPADGSSAIGVSVKVTRGLDATPVGNAKVKLVAGDQFIDLDGDGTFSGADQIVGAGDRNQDGLWDAEGSLPNTVTTDSNGSASFLFTAGTHEGNVYIKATTEGASKDLVLYEHPTSLQVRTFSERRELLADGVSQTLIETTVLDWGGSPIAGVIVRYVAGEPFSDVNGDGYYTAGTDNYQDTNSNGKWDAIGSIESVSPTDQNGASVASYTAGLRVGQVEIRATTSAGSAVTAVDLVAVPPASTVDLDLGLSILPADGVSSTGGTVVVRDVNGAAITGKEIHLVAGERFNDVNHDGVFTAGVDELLDDADHSGTWTAIGAISSSVFTDASGVGSFTYVSGLAPGTVWVRAAADGVSVERQLDLQDLPTAWTMNLSADQERLSVLGAGGVDNTVVTANAFDVQGNPVPAGVPVDFSVASGPGGGEKIQGATQGVYRAYTNANGVASAVLTAGTLPGVVTVQAISGSTSRLEEVTIGSGRAASINARSVAPSVDFWSETDIEAAVQDAQGNPVEDGTSVQFTVDEGLIVGSEGGGVSKTEGGIAVATYRSLGPNASTDYVAEIHVAVPNTTAQTDIELPLNEPGASVIGALDLTTSSAEINVQGSNGDQECIIFAQALDELGREVGSGYEITFNIVDGPGGGEALGNFGTGPATATTDAQGVASIILRAGTIAGPVEIQATHGTALPALVQVGIAAYHAGTVECDIRYVVDNRWEVWAYVYDSEHNSAPDGTVVWFRANVGILDGLDGEGSTVLIDGVARCTYYSLYNPPDGGDTNGRITCQSLGATSCELLVTAPPGQGEVSSINLTAARTEIGVQGTGAVEQTTVLAQAVDTYGNTVPDTPITFDIAGGPGGGEKLLPTDGPVVVYTDPFGVASVTLRSGTISGTVLVSATANNEISQTTPVAIAAGPPAYLHIGAEACNVLACGRVNVENPIVVIVSDTYHNPVRDGTVVYFTTDKGTVRGQRSGNLGSDFTVDGVGGALWLSGSSCETVTVTASTAAGGVTNSVAFLASDDPYSATILSPSSDVVSLPADGESRFTMWVEVLDVFGTYVLPAGIEVEAEFGSIPEQGESGDGCHSSVARVIYQSKTLDRDYSVTTPDDGVGAVDNVTVSTGYGGR